MGVVWACVDIELGCLRIPYIVHKLMHGLEIYCVESVNRRILMELLWMKQDKQVIGDKIFWLQKVAMVGSPLFIFWHIAEI